MYDSYSKHAPLLIAGDELGMPCLWRVACFQPLHVEKHFLCFIAEYRKRMRRASAAERDRVVRKGWIIMRKEHHQSRM